MSLNLSYLLWHIYGGWFLQFLYLVLALQNNDNLLLFAFVFSQQNNNKTIRKNEIHKALISAAKHLAPQYIVFSPRNNDKLRNFVAKRR